MKRSKMVLEIEERLDELYSPFNYHNNYAAIDILKLIEELGMLPPVNTCKVVDGKHTPSERSWDNEENS